MRIHEWVRYIHPPFQPSTKAAWNFVCNEAQAPLVAAAWCRLEATDKRFFIVVPDSERALQWQARLGLCGIPEGKIKQLPSGLSNLFDDGSPEKNALSDRLMALNEMLNSEEYVVIATANSALEKTISPEKFRSSTLDLKIGDEIPTDNLLLKLQAMGYEVEEPVRRPGGVSRRGGIIDVFAGGSEMPTRIEFFGDTIDSLRRFDPESQRSILPVEKVCIPPLRNVVYPDDVEETIKKMY
jgi:transcription-repair coupling factor (superfamily II helicase)